jgi:CDP-glucose 4,6-dehydratase
MARQFDIYRGRRVLVTGHSGFKGSWLALWLSRLGAEVTGLSDGIPTQPNHFEALGLTIHDRRGDVVDDAAVPAAIASARPDIIFHFAAQALVRKAYADPVGTYRTNVIGTLTAMEAARAAGVPAFVSATTDKVYRNDESGRRYKEEDELGGADPYSASKSCVELMSRSYREALIGDGPMLLATVRAGNVVGGGDWADDRIVPDLMRAAFSGEPAVIRNPDSTRPWQHVLDVLAGYLAVGARLLDSDRAAAEAWNLGPVESSAVRVQDVIAAVQRQIPELRVDIRPDASGRAESGLLQLDSTKAVSRLGWRPRWESEMLERTVDWYRAFYKDGQVISEAQLDAYEDAVEANR